MLPKTIICFCLAVALLLQLNSAEGAEKKDRFFADMVQTLTPANAPDKVDQLASGIKTGKVTVDDFAAYYFRKTGNNRSSDYRRRWERNMRINFRIINHQNRKYDSRKEILARRAVEVTLYRLND